MPLLLELALRELRGGGRALWVFAACLMLGVGLVAAGGGLYRQVAGGLQTEVRALFGGDLELEAEKPLPAEAIAWLSARGRVSAGIELRTMLRGEGGRAQLVELQSIDAAYPLVGRLRLQPALQQGEALAQQLGLRDGHWGLALDPVLARRLGLELGGFIEVGEVRLQLRHLLLQQPDRNLRADWRGAPVLLSDGGLRASGLVQPLSRVDYRWRLVGSEPPRALRDGFADAFPALDKVELRSVTDRGERVARVIDQIGSGLLLVGFSALFIGGLGVFNSVQAFLAGKLRHLATLRALGLRDARLAALVLLQILLLALVASLAGALLGGLLALGGLQLLAERLPIAASLPQLLHGMALAVGFGLLTALAFALPALGRALSISPAALFRGLQGARLHTPRLAILATLAAAALLLLLLIVLMPDPRFGLAFVAACVLVLLLLEALLRLLRRFSSWLLARPGWQPGFELRVALAGMQRPGSPLRPALLSLGTALTLLVACTLVVAALLRTVNETVPQQAPGLVLYDLQTPDLERLDALLAGTPSLSRAQTAPLVLGHLVEVNGERLAESADPGRRREAGDEHKFSHRAGNIDDVILQRGAWWPADYQGLPLMAMEDREADQLGLQIGDRLRFEILGQSLEVELAAIYGQRRYRARLWLEGLFSDGALDPFVTRHVGAVWLGPEDAITVQDRVAAELPHVISLRTQAMLDATRALMAQAGAALSLIAGACLAASLLVLASVIAASRARQSYEASLMHTLGARVASLRRVLQWEYALLGLLTAGFALLAGTLLAEGLLRFRLELSADGLTWTGAVTALAVSLISLGVGARSLLSRLKLSPAQLLRSSA